MVADTRVHEISGDAVIVYRRAPGNSNMNRYVIFDSDGESVEVSEGQLNTLMEAYRLEHEDGPGSGGGGGGPP